jgi:4-hydroxybenzoate polyprenyltransferase
MKAKAFFSWVRIPTVFSSMGNAYAGWWLGGHEEGLNLALGLAAAALFLMAGMGLNDIADRKVDSVERPTRPLPSGAISLPAAWVWALGMLGMGLALQAMAHVPTTVVGLTLVTAIFLYNFALKGTWLGPLSMGLCRALNVLAGMALNWETWPWTWDLSLGFGQRLALISLGAYIALVTFLARDEVQGNARFRVRLFLFFFGLWTGGWIAMGVKGVAPLWGLVPTGFALMALIGPPLGRLWREPSPKHTGQMVGTLLRGIPLVDMLALWAAGCPWFFVLPMLAFLVPGPILMKRFYST